MRLLSLSLFFTLICLSTNHSSAEVELLISPDGHEIHFLSMPDAENVAIQIK